MSRTSTDTSLPTLLREAGLTGRGGAAFDTATKIVAAQRHGADLVVNACDGEIGAAKDAWIVAHRLDELVAGARAVATSSGRVRFAAHRASASAARLAAAGLDVLEVPRRYVSSEETSLISLAHGSHGSPDDQAHPAGDRRT